MSALSKLQKLLPLDKADSVQNLSPDFSELDNLKKVLNHNGRSSPRLLESLRIQAIPSDPSELRGLSQDDLDQLIIRFQSYQEQLHKHREKLIPIESIISGFNTELDQLSSSLVALHEKSAKLTNHSSTNQSTTEKLNPIILDLIISPEVVKSILHDDVDAKWVENVKFINEKLQLIATIHDVDQDSTNATSNAYRGSVALQQLESGIQLLIQKCIERIRDFFISQIKLLRSSTKASSQTVQQSLLQVKETFTFLKTHHPDLANQLQLAYIYTMRWYYQTKFAKYIYALENLNIRHIDSTLVLGNLGSEDKGIFGSGFKGWLSSNTTTNLQKAPAASNHVTMNDYLSSIDKRLQILNDKSDSEPHSAIPSQIAETTPFAYWLEFIYHQWSIALIDNLVVEYFFMVDFFYQGNEKFDVFSAKSNTTPATESKQEWSQIMFEGVFKIGREFVSWLISHAPVYQAKGIPGSTATTASARSNLSPNLTSTSYGSCDAFAILLMIRMAQNSQSLMHKEFHIPILDDYLNSILLILWPHFTKIIDLNCESLKKTILRTSKETTLAPVSVTQQFSQFVSGLLKLSLSTSKEGSDDFRGEPLFISINRLRNDFENLLTKLSNHFFGSGKNKSVEKEIFLYNNYFLVVSILKNENSDYSKRDRDGDDGIKNIIDEQVQHFEALCNAYKK